ncbi:hypothetical protein [Frankia canadensis]|uniref:hypothetical protein n=1 Tax=Frankia canadensis TaxID=1836972 RepID=UPI0014020480|nr:hypothetical protein [Frankia canadensis]
MSFDSPDRLGRRSISASFDRTLVLCRGLFRVVFGGLQAEPGEREHVDQPARDAADVAGAEDGVEFAVNGWVGVGEEVFADAEDRR